MLKVGTNVQLPGALDRWQVGGSVHAQSKTTVNYCPSPVGACLPVEAVQPEYAVFDLRAGFDVDRNWRVALSVNNVFDKVYYEAMDPTLYVWHGEPRNWMLRIDGRY